MAILRPHEIVQARQAGRIAADTLVMIGPHIRPGITTGELNRIIHDYTLERKARPAPLGYKGFPKSCCVSVNDVVCHGIPGDRVLEDGDIVNVDVTPIFPARSGYHGDTSVTFYVGTPSPEARHVVETARQCLELGLSVVRPGRRTGDIGAIIQEFAEAQGCSVVREYTGHGTGRIFHDKPTIHHHGTAGQGEKLRRGMCFTIEPMINFGGATISHLDDGWTVLTKDGSLSAQFEHTVVVTKRGCEVLTARSAVVQGSEDVSWARLGPLSSYQAAG